jgi:hypothetical protein
MYNTQPAIASPHWYSWTSQHQRLSIPVDWAGFLVSILDPLRISQLSVNVEIVL